MRAFVYTEALFVMIQPVKLVQEEMEFFSCPNKTRVSFTEIPLRIVIIG